MKKGFAHLILLIIIVLIGIAGIGYLAFKNSQENFKPLSNPIFTVTPTIFINKDNWNTYTDPNNIFSFKFPQSFKVNPIKFLKDYQEYYLEIDNDDNVVGYLTINKKGQQYKINESPTKTLSLEEWLDWNLYSDCKQVDIMSGYECASNPYGKNNIFIFVSKYNDRFIELTGNIQNKETFDQILSTFKFINVSNNNTVNCKPADLDITASVDNPNLHITLANKSSLPCKINRFLDITLKNSVGMSVPIDLTYIQHIPAVDFVVLNQFGDAKTLIYFKNYCLENSGMYYFYLNNNPSEIYSLTADQKNAGACENINQKPYVSAEPLNIEKNGYYSEK